jgi:hypothetical protein
VVEDAASVIKHVFEEAERRDPEHERTWVALVDGNSHQIDRIEKEAARRKMKITVVIDVIHVLEYLWTAAWCFFAEGDPPRHGCATGRWPSSTAAPGTLPRGSAGAPRVNN